ncbi:MAG: DUF2249 domain-containing protein [Halobacteriales archaeon]
MGSEIDTAATRTLDARDIDGEPFSEIMETLEALGGDDSLLLINSFEPEPLYDVLEQRGFTYETTRIGSDEWRVRIEPT